jgi:chromate reductase
LLPQVYTKQDAKAHWPSFDSNQRSAIGKHREQAAISSASPGRSGGLRSLMALRQILELGCGALVIPEQVAIPQADHAFDERDNIADTGIANLFRAQLARLVDMARMMM